MQRKELSPAENWNSLPEELKSEIGESVGLEAKILTLFEDYGGTLNLDEVLVGLFKKFEEIETRKKVTGILYRMAKRGDLVKGEKRGEYSIPLNSSADDEIPF